MIFAEFDYTWEPWQIVMCFTAPIILVVGAFLLAVIFGDDNDGRPPPI